MNKKTRRMQATVVLFALTAIGALAVSPHTASTQDTGVAKEPTQNTISSSTSVDNYSLGYRSGYQKGKNDQAQVNANNNSNSNADSTTKGGCCGGA